MTLTTPNGKFQESDDFSPALNSVRAKTNQHGTMYCSSIKTQVSVSINTFWHWGRY